MAGCLLGSNDITALFQRVRPFWSNSFIEPIDQMLSNPNRTPAMNEILPWYFPEPDNLDE
jgi:hypothetical protein